MIHSNICESKKLSEISLAAETLYYRLLTRADDDGNFTADPRIVLGQCAPLRKEWHEKIVLELLEELSTITVGDKKPLIQFYTKDGDKFLHITRFEEFQYLRPDRVPTVKFPTHPTRMGESLVNQRYVNGMTMPNLKERKEKLSEDKLREEKVTTTSDFRNIAVRYRKSFQVTLSHGTMQKDSYAKACLEYGEDVVLKKFESWAPDNMWIKEKRHTNGLRQFYEALPAMIEADAAITLEKAAEEVAAAEQQDAATRAVEQGHAEFKAREAEMLAQREEEEALAANLVNNPFGDA